jgi:hypothetical protein
MLYESNHAKKYIIIGICIVFLAVLVAAALPLISNKKVTEKSKPGISPEAKQAQEKIFKEQDALIEATKNMGDAVPTPDEISKEQDRLIENTKTSGTNMSLEDIQKEQDRLTSETLKK